MKSMLPMLAFCPSVQQEAFKGDHELLVDRLVVASQKKQVDDSLLQERALVPFFQPSDSAITAFEPLERRKSPAQQVQQLHHGLKRNAGDRSGANLASSPPKKENQLHLAKQRRGGKPAQGAASVSGRRMAYHSDSEVSSVSSVRATASPAFGEPSKPVPSPASGQRKHTRASDSPAPSAGQPRRSPSPPHKREHHLASSVDGAGSPLRFGAAGKFAGPAFCNSPTPDSLPIPSLLMQQAADSLRSRLML